MWKSEWTDELQELFAKYREKFICEPDDYDEILYSTMTYDEFVRYIKETLIKSLARFLTMKNLFKIADYAVKTRFFTVFIRLGANKSAYPAVALNKSALT